LIPAILPGIKGFFMRERQNATRLLHALGKADVTRHGLGCIGKSMQTSKKTLTPATDQGTAAPLLTTEEVASWLRVAPKTLRNWRSDGIGPVALKLHGVVRYDRAAVESWISATSKAAV
jgi:hypothetical protein